MTEHRSKMTEKPFERYFYKEYSPIRAGNIDGSDEFIHDNAVIRAIHSNFKPDKKLKSTPKNTIFVGNLNPRTDETCVKKYFSRIGDIKSCKVVRDIVTGMSKRYAFIEFKDKKYVKRASSLNQTFIEQSKIIVQRECGRNLKGWKPRRLGGGLGGHRGSGQLRFGGVARPFEDADQVFKRAIDDFPLKKDRYSSGSSSRNK